MVKFKAIVLFGLLNKNKKKIVFFSEQLSQNRQGNSPLAAASKMVPVPESLMSPDCPPPGGVVHRSGSVALQHHTPSAYSPKTVKSKSG